MIDVTVMDLRKKHLLAGFALILFFFLCLVGLTAVAYMSGFVGEFARLCLALITSPFLMVGSILFLALPLLFGINAWRRNQEGEDYLELDEVGEPIRVRGRLRGQNGGEIKRRVKV